MKRKVAMIAHAFPPCHAIGALRAAKFAKYLPKHGWEPIVITRTWPEGMCGLEGPPGIRVIRTAYHDRLGIFRRANRPKTESSPEEKRSSSGQSRLRQLASFWIKEFLAYPDEFIGWRSHALEAARRVFKEEKISVIFSTSPPPTSHLIAHELQRRIGLPWVADFRDLWTQNHYFRHTLPRQWLETRLEKRTMQNASILITVSHPLAQKLGQLHKKPVEVITNGFDEDDYAGPPPPPTPYFSITYTGQIYAGKRDPSLLFAAVRELLDSGAIDPQRFRIRFYGPDESLVEKLAASFGVDTVVEHEGFIPYRESIQRQRESTALLLLNWRSLEERGIYTGKVFEYLGARRPILAMPRNDGVIDALLHETRAGVVADTVEEVAMVLKEWFSRFEKNGALPYQGNEAVIKHYTRDSLTKRLAAIFDSCTKRGEGI